MNQGTISYCWQEHKLVQALQTASLVAQTVKRLPEMRETRVRSLGQEDPLEKEMAIHSSILAWRIPWTEKPGCMLQSMGCTQSDTTERLYFTTDSNNEISFYKHT